MTRLTKLERRLKYRQENWIDPLSKKKVVKTQFMQESDDPLGIHVSPYMVCEYCFIIFITDYVNIKNYVFHE